MKIRFALLALFALTAAAPAKRTKPVPVKPLPDIVRVAMTTELGTITMDIDAKRAPITARNFINYVDQKRFDGTTFYRVMKLEWGTPPNGIIQAGPRGDQKRVLKPIAHEPTTVTGILHKAGTLSMARLAPGTATGDFTILLSDQPYFDADPAREDPGTRDGYAAFGQVVDGMEVARKIYDVPLSPTLGEGILKGQMIAKPVKIISARRVVIAPSPAPVNVR